MGENSAIEWTDATWNPVRGCSRVSEGCRNCYAEQIAARFSGRGQPFHGFASRTAAGGRWTGRVEVIDSKLKEPLKWKKPRRIFVNSMSDLFHPELTPAEIDQVYSVMREADWHVYQVLTKRPRYRRHVFEVLEHDPPTHIWEGVSVESRDHLERIDILRETPAAIRFLSAEPLLGDLGILNLKGIDWVIIGGESGKNARPMHPMWALDVISQCREQKVPVFFKQTGAWGPSGIRPDAGLAADRGSSTFRQWLAQSWIGARDILMDDQGRVCRGDAELQRAKGDDAFRVTIQPTRGKGGDPSMWPPVFRVREFPEVAR